MIWEQNCQLVVMVTAESEGGRVKCERYWPEKVRGSMQAWDVSYVNFGMKCKIFAHQRNLSLLLS